MVFGKSNNNNNNNNNIEMSAIAAGTGGFVIMGNNANEESGNAVAGAGDVNGDGLADLIIGVAKSDIGTDVDIGRAYVVFGKSNDNNAINLSDIAAGTGGFVINGQSAGDKFGTSVSSAGDVNGDGLSDLIVGASEADFSASTLDAGKSYVIFGKTDTKPVSIAVVAAGIGLGLNYYNTPTGGADTVVGTTAAEIIFGAAGNDTITGAGGADVLLGGAGNDLLRVNASNIAALTSGPVTLGIDIIDNPTQQLARIDGGTGIDTLQLGGGASIDFTQISQIAASNPKVGSRVSSIERIDLATDTAANTVKISLFDVLDMAGMNLFNTSAGSGWTGTGLGTSVARHQVVITGSNTDTVDIDGFAISGGTNVWAKAAGTVMNNGVTFDIWNHNTAAAQLLIQQSVQVI